VAHGGEIVRDEQVVEPVRSSQLLQQLEVLRFDRHVERTDRLVAHGEARVRRDRACDPDALSLATRELVR
jgi:hypothetical protein